MVCLGLEPGAADGGADESSELWQHPYEFVFYLSYFLFVLLCSIPNY